VWEAAHVLSALGSVHAQEGLLVVRRQALFRGQVDAAPWSPTSVLLRWLSLSASSRLEVLQQKSARDGESGNG
jgi:hypothetical protein